jgi:hypothetical protein
MSQNYSPDGGCSDLVLQLLLGFFYYLVILPVGSIGRLLPVSTYYRTSGAGASPTEKPHGWALGGAIVLLVLGFLGYLFWSWIGIAVVLAFALLVVWLGWSGKFEHELKMGRPARRKRSTSKQKKA